MEKTICVFGDSITMGAWDLEKGGWVNRLRLFIDVEQLSGKIKDYFNTPLNKPQTPLSKRTLEPYDTTQWVSPPGLTCLVLTPIDFVCTCCAWVQAYALGDQQTKLDAEIRLTAMPLAFTYAVLSFFTTVFQVGAALKLSWELLPGHVLIAFALPIMILGLVICAIGAGLESFGIYKQIDLLANLHDSEDPKERLTFIKNQCFIR